MEYNNTTNNRASTLLLSALFDAINGVVALLHEINTPDVVVSAAAATTTASDGGGFSLTYTVMWLLQNSWAFVLYVAASLMLSGTRMGLLFLDHHRAGYVCSIAVYMVSVASMYVRASHSERPPPRCT